MAKPLGRKVRRVGAVARQQAAIFEAERRGLARLGRHHSPQAHSAGVDPAAVRSRVDRKGGGYHLLLPDVWYEIPRSDRVPAGDAPHRTRLPRPTPALTTPALTTARSKRKMRAASRSCARARSPRQCPLRRAFRFRWSAIRSRSHVFTIDPPRRPAGTGSRAQPRGRLGKTAAGGDRGASARSARDMRAKPPSSVIRHRPFGLNPSGETRDQGSHDRIVRGDVASADRCACGEGGG